MKKMREMKNSGIDWIGEIPSPWHLERLCNVSSSIFMGVTPIYSEDENELYIVGQKNNQPGHIDLKGIKYATPDFYNKRSQDEFLKYGDTLLNTLGGGSVGRVGYWDCNIKAITDGHILVFRPSKDTNSRYLFYSLLSRQKVFEDESVGSTNQSFLTKLGVYKHRIPYPSFKEQTRIANFLDKKVAAIDNVIAKTRESIEEYKKLKQSIITKAVTKGLNPNAEMKDSGIEWIGKIPCQWTINIIFQLFNQVKNKNKNMIESNLLSLSYGKIVRKNIDSTYGLLPENFEGYNIIEKNDIVLRLTDLQNDHKSLRVGLSKERGIITSAYTSLRLKNANSPEYLYYYLHVFDISKGFYGMGDGVRQGLNWDELKQLKVCLPPINEQTEIVSFLHSTISQYDKLINEKETIVLELEEYKKSLIYEYVTGKKEVSNV